MAFFTRYVLNLEISLNMAKNILSIYGSFCIAGSQHLF